MEKALTSQEIHSMNSMEYYIITFPSYHLCAGWHHIEIHAEGSGRYGELLDDIYVGSKYTANDLPTKSVSSTVEINFFIGDATATPASQPTANSTILMTHPPPTNIDAPSDSFFVLILTVTAMAILIVSLSKILLFYRRHRKKNQTSR
jgi:hypothetical protein